MAASEQSSACVQHPLGLALIRRGTSAVDEPFFQATGAVCSLPMSDAGRRRVGISERRAGSRRPSQARAAAAWRSTAASIPAWRSPRWSPRHQTHDIELRVINVNAASLLLDSRTRAARRQEQPAAALSRRQAHVPLRLGRRRAERRSSRPDTFKDKIVFVGTTALGTREVVATPIDTLFAGVEVQATVADNLLQQDFIHRPEYGVTVETQIVLGTRDRRRAAGRHGSASRGAALGIAALPRGVVWGGAVAADVGRRRLPVAASFRRSA